ELIATNKDIAARVEKLERGQENAASVIEVLIKDIDSLGQKIERITAPSPYAKHRIAYITANDYQTTISEITMPLRTELFLKGYQDNEFWAIHGKSIHSYAVLENRLCMLFSELSGITLEIGKIIFFKIVSSDARYNIIDKLFKLQFGQQYNTFRNSLLEDL